jgi:hypothetical protein
MTLSPNFHSLQASVELVSMAQIHEPDDLGTVDDDDSEGIVLIGDYGSCATTDMCTVCGCEMYDNAS